MVKKILGMDDILKGPSRTFGEFSLLTDYTPEGCTIETISLAQDLCGIKMGIPFLSAAMQSVTGFELALEIARNDGLGVLPGNLDIGIEAGLVEKIKKQDMPLIEDYVYARPSETIEQVLGKVAKYGHSTIPVVDRFLRFLGWFRESDYDRTVPKDNPVKNVMIPRRKITTCRYRLTFEEVQKEFGETEQKCLPMLDSARHLHKLAFKRDIEKPKVAAATSSHADWRERVGACIEAGADMIIFDSSHGHNYYQEHAIMDYKKDSRFKDVPVCGGNVITAKGFRYLAEAGADIVKVGMGVGSICTTAETKATGRGQYTAVYAVVKARDRFFKKTGKYIPIIADGGISYSGQMVIALTTADFIMMGNYFNKFFEAAGRAIDSEGNFVEKNKFDDSRIRFIETWGEGSERAKNYVRYGHLTKKTSFAEGIEGKVKYGGMMKPSLERDVSAIKAALRDTGSYNLRQFRENSEIELRSEHSLLESRVHDVV